MLEGDPETGDTSDAGMIRAFANERGILQMAGLTRVQNVRAERQSRQAPTEADRESRERSLAESDEERDTGTAADDGHARADDVRGRPRCRRRRR